MVTWIGKLKIHCYLIELGHQTIFHVYFILWGIGMGFISSLLFKLFSYAYVWHVMWCQLSIVELILLNFFAISVELQSLVGLRIPQFLVLLPFWLSVGILAQYVCNMYRAWWLCSIPSGPQQSYHKFSTRLTLWTWQTCGRNLIMFFCNNHMLDVEIWIGRGREKLFIAVVCMQDACIFPVSVEILLPQRQPG